MVEREIIMYSILFHTLDESCHLGVKVNGGDVLSLYCLFRKKYVKWQVTHLKFGPILRHYQEK